MSAATAMATTSTPAVATVTRGEEQHQSGVRMNGSADIAIGDLLAAEEMDDYSNDSNSEMDDQDEDGLECEESLVTGNTQPSQGHTGNETSQHDGGSGAVGADNGGGAGTGNGTATSGLKTLSHLHPNKDDAKRERLEKRRRSNRESARRMRQQRIQRLAKLQEELTGLRHTKQQLNSKQEMLARDYENALAEHNSLKQRLSQLQSKLRGTGSMQVDVMAYTYPSGVAASGLNPSVRTATPKHGPSSLYHPSTLPQRTPQSHAGDDSSLMFPTMKRPAPSGPLDGQPRPKRPMEGQHSLAQSPKESMSGGPQGSAQHANGPTASTGSLPNTSPNLISSPSVLRHGIPPHAPSSAPHRLEPPDDPGHLSGKHLNVRRQLLPPSGQASPLLTSQGGYSRGMANDMLAGPNTPTRRAAPPMPPTLMMSRAHSAPLTSNRSSPYPSYTHDSAHPQPLPLRPPQRTAPGMVPSMAMPSPGTLSSSSIPMNGRSPVTHARMYNRPHTSMDPTSQTSVPPTVRLQQGHGSNSPFPQSRFAAPSMVGNVNGAARTQLPSPNPSRIPPTLSRAAARALMASQAMADFSHQGSQSMLNPPYSSSRLDPSFAQNKMLSGRPQSAGGMMDEEYGVSKPHLLPPHRSPSVGTLVDMRRLTPLPRTASPSPHHSVSATSDTPGHPSTIPTQPRLDAFNPLPSNSSSDPSNMMSGMPSSGGNLLDPLRPTPGMPGTLQRLPSGGDRSRGYSNMPSPTVPTQSSQTQPRPLPLPEPAPQFPEWQDDPCDPFPMPMPGWSGGPATSAPPCYSSPTLRAADTNPSDALQLPLPEDLLSSPLLRDTDLHPTLPPLPSTLDANLSTKHDGAPSVTLQPLPTSPTLQNVDTSSPTGLPNMLSGLAEFDMDILGADSFLDNMIDDDEEMRKFMEGVISPSPILGPRPVNPEAQEAGAAEAGGAAQGQGEWQAAGEQNGAGGSEAKNETVPAPVSTPDGAGAEKLRGDDWIGGANWCD